MNKLELMTVRVAQTYNSGKPDLYILARYHGDKKVELVHFSTLLNDDTYSAVISELPDGTTGIKRLFPEGSLVWAKTVFDKSGGKWGVHFQEATCEDDQARHQLQIVIKKIKDQSYIRTTITDGEARNLAIRAILEGKKAN